MRRPRCLIWNQGRRTLARYRCLSGDSISGCGGLVELLLLSLRRVDVVGKGRSRAAVKAKKEVRKKKRVNVGDVMNDMQWLTQRHLRLTF